MPVLDLHDQVIEESHDILKWALAQSDPENLQHDGADLAEMHQLIEQSDREFKPLLDRYKYPTRYENEGGDLARDRALPFLDMLEARLSEGGFLFHGQIGVADLGIWPFIRQFAHVDRDWFWAQDRPHLISWLDYFSKVSAFKRLCQSLHPGKRAMIRYYFL